MPLPETLLEVLKQDGVVAITTIGRDGPHMVNTWHNYIRFSEDGRLLIPAGYMNQTQANVEADNRVLLTMGSSKVPGKRGPGTGFLINGTANFITEGLDFDVIKASFPWARGVLAITVSTATQTL